MVEIFKTDVKDADQANVLIDIIQRFFLGYVANFDLEDCDKILRVESVKGEIKSSMLIRLLLIFNCKAEVLTDEFASLLPERKK